MKSAMSIMQDYYPEGMAKSFIVNAPMLFSGVWSMVKNFLDEKTVKKVNILRYGKDELLEEIDED